MASRELREAELKRIHDRDGGVKPSVLVDESKPKTAPLHDEFEWEDKKAAAEYRLAQARRVIRVTVYRTGNGERQQFIHVPVTYIDGPTAVITEREGIYKPVQEIAKNASDYQAALTELQKQVNSIVKTIRVLEKAGGVKNKPLVQTLADCMVVAKDTVKLLIFEAC